jgi:hypothetical protein
MLAQRYWKAPFYQCSHTINFVEFGEPSFCCLPTDLGSFFLIFSKPSLVSVMNQLL